MKTDREVALEKSLQRCLAEAEEWLMEARGVKPHEVIDYDGWADEARRLLAQTNAPLVEADIA